MQSFLQAFPLQILHLLEGDVAALSECAFVHLWNLAETAAVMVSIFCVAAEEFFIPCCIRASVLAFSFFFLICP